MKKVLVLVSILLVAVVAWTGALRPGAKASLNPADPTLGIAWLDRLMPHTNVRAADLQGQPCWDDAGRMTVPAGTRCAASLPSPGYRLTVCVTAGEVENVLIAGSQYGPQKARPGQLNCAKAKAFELYDQSSRLVVDCGEGPACRLELR